MLAALPSRSAVELSWNLDGVSLDPVYTEDAPPRGIFIDRMEALSL
jgi:hypothetical protein